MEHQTRSTIPETLLRLAHPRLSPKELFRLARKAHPDASRTEIVRAAFSTVIAVADRDPEKARMLQDFAIRSRTGDDN